VRRGLTLIEVLVAVGVIGLLVAILAPTLAGARGLAQQSVSLNNARQCWGIVEDYAQANQERYPRCLPNTAYGAPGGAGGASSSEVGAAYLTITLWFSAVRDVAPFHQHREVFVSPGRQFTEGSFAASYRLMPAFFIKGTLWTETATSMSEAELASLARDVRRNEVSFPAGKAGMYDYDLSYVRKPRPRIDGLPDEPTAVAFADGHAGARNPQDAAEPFPNAHQPDQPPVRLHDTPRGAQGRDY